MKEFLLKTKINQFIVVLLIILFSFISCITIPQIKDKDDMQKSAVKNPMLANYYLSRIDFMNSLVLISIKGNLLPSFRINGSMEYNSFIKCEIDMEMLNKRNQYAALFYSYDENAGYFHSYILKNKQLFPQDFLEIPDYALPAFENAIHYIFLMFRDNAEIVANSDGLHTIDGIEYIKRDKVLESMSYRLEGNTVFITYKEYTQFDDILYPKKINISFNEESFCYIEFTDAMQFGFTY